MSDIEHAETLLRTGFWGRKAAGVLFLAATTGRLGLVLRSWNVLEPGTWGVVGGAVDPSEDKRKAAAREALEEVGLKVSPKALRALDVFKAANGFEYHTFLAVLPKECPACRLNWENDDFAWFDLSSLPSPLHPGVANTLSKPSVVSKLNQFGAR